MGEVCWCVILCDLLAGCSFFLRAWAGCWLGCLGVFPTWCSKAGADTGSICNRTSFNGHVFYFKLWVLFMWVEPWFYSLLTKTFFPRCVTLLVVMRSSGVVVKTHLHCHFVCAIIMSRLLGTILYRLYRFINTI